MSGDAVPVVFVSSSAEVGGAELYLESLLERLGEGWVDTVVVPEAGEFSERLRAAGQPLEIVPFGRRLGLLAGAVRLRRVLRRRAARGVHANGSRAAVVCALATSPRSALIWARVDRTMDGRAGALVAARCSRIVAASANALEGLGAAARQRAEVVYPGVPAYPVDRAAGRELVLDTLGCPPDAEVVVLSGRLGPSKGQAELLTAAPAVLERRGRARFVFLGGHRTAFPDYEDRLLERARDLGVERRVHFLGHRGAGIASVADSVRFVSGCDLLVAPSMREAPYGWQEGFGLAVAEAMHVGTPVVVYRNGSLPEVVGDCGAVVREGDVAALAEEIVRVLGDPALRARMATCGKARVAAEFDRERAVAELRRVYEISDRARSR
jgi:glycosyltransferase involved in cell wall biosynthesis